MTEKNKLKTPFTFYTPQKSYTRYVETAMRNGGVILLEAGTGFGKTVSNLYGTFSGLDADETSLYYLSRTHEQNEQIVKELEALNTANFPDVRTGIQIASRHQLCHVPEVRDSPPAIASDLCMEFRKLRKKKGFRKARDCCSLSTLKDEESLIVKLPIILGLDDLRTIASHGCCAYLTCRELITLHDVIAGNYLYFLSDSIRENIGIPLRNARVILDEGHNLERVLEDIYSRNLRTYHLQKAIEEVQVLSNFRLGDFLENFRDLFHWYGKKAAEEEIPFSCHEFIDRCHDFSIDQESVDSFLEDVSLTREEILTEMRKISKKKRLSFLNVDRVYSFAENIFLSPEDFGLIAQKSGKGFKLTLQCLNPALPFSNVVKHAKTIVICSGTLSPIDLQQEILGIPSAVKKQFGTVINPDHAKIVLISHGPGGQLLTTRYTYRNENPEVFDDYRTAIHELMAMLPEGGGLAFFPSYSIMEQISPELMDKTFNCYVEPRNASDNHRVLQDYKDDIDQGQKALLCGVLGGKFSEGANFPGNYSRAVIVNGIPYPPPDPYITLKRAFYEKKRRGLGNEWYAAQAFRKVAQALGRGWRNKEDYAMGFLLDKRYIQSEDQFPLWLAMRMKRIESWKLIKQEIKAFFTKHQV
ncbi:MAG: helicase C-terminal domain-containing protein [Candidatus Odinarchaeota archaeon]